MQSFLKTDFLGLWGLCGYVVVCGLCWLWGVMLFLLVLLVYAVSAGSACNADSSESSHVLSVLGLSDALANSSIRFSFGRFTKLIEIDYAIERFTYEVNRLKDIMDKAPEWCRN